MAAKYKYKIGLASGETLKFNLDDMQLFERFKRWVQADTEVKDHGFIVSIAKSEFAINFENVAFIECENP